MSFHWDVNVCIANNSESAFDIGNDQISDGVMISQDSYIHSSKLYGAIMHTTKLCMERPRKKEARWANMHIAPDEKIESYELDYDGKRDRWNGFDAATYARITERYKARRMYMMELQIKKLEEKNIKLIGEGEISEDNEDDDVLKVDEAKVDESKQMDFVKVKKRVCMMLNCNLVLAQNNGSSPC
ncbi:hypothetical protein ACFX2I_012647 [Malus domestica]